MSFNSFVRNFLDKGPRGALSALALMATLPVIDISAAEAALTKDPLSVSDQFPKGPITGPWHEAHIPSPRERLFTALQSIQELRMKCLAPESAVDDRAKSRLASLDATSIDEYRTAYSRAIGLTTFTNEAVDESEIEHVAITLEQFAQLLIADLQACKILEE